MLVLILSDETDEHALHVQRALRDRNVDTELLDSRWFPGALGLDFDPRSGDGSFTLPNGRRIAFNDVHSVYWRSYCGVSPARLPDAEQDYIAENDSRSLFESILIHLPTRWINSWHAFQLHQRKPVQLAMVAGLGVDVPATLLTNQPSSVGAFAARCSESIFKPVQGGAYAQRLTAHYLQPKHLENLSFAPVTLQQEAPGTNVRVFVAGQRVMACRLDSRTLDYRDDPKVHISAVPLSQDAQIMCRRISEKLDLHWTGIDFREAPDGNLVFLEANPSPMFMGFETATDLPLTDALVDLLIDPSQSQASQTMRRSPTRCTA